MVRPENGPVVSQDGSVSNQLMSPRSHDVGVEEILILQPLRSATVGRYHAAARTKTTHTHTHTSAGRRSPLVPFRRL